MEYISNTIEERDREREERNWGGEKIILRMCCHTRFFVLVPTHMRAHTRLDLQLQISHARDIEKRYFNDYIGEEEEVFRNLFNDQLIIANCLYKYCQHLLVLKSYLQQLCVFVLTKSNPIFYKSR